MVVALTYNPQQPQTIDLKLTAWGGFKHFRFVFRLNRANTEKLISQNRLDIDPEEVAGLYLNCQFDGNRLICTTGTALTFFSMDRVLDHLWDEMVERFFQRNKIFFVQS